MSFMLKRVAFLLPGLLGLAAGCGGSNLVLPSEGVAAKIVVVSGDKQAGVVGVPLVNNIFVRVTDSKDRPVQSQQVTFTPADASSGQAVPPSATTNADGQVSVQWVLGAVAGTQTMLAKAVGNGAPANLSVIFTATASSSVPSKLDKVAGDGQTAPAGATVATAPAVKVIDAQGNPVAGVGVTFAVATGGGSVNPTTPVATNASGIASVTSWTLGAVAGPNTLTATAAGTGISGNPATFTATGVVGAAAKLGLAVAPSATAASGVPLATQPQVQVQDATGNPVAKAGVSVSVAISSGGGTLSGGATVVQTDAAGLAVFSGLTISGTAGSYTLLFSASGLASTTAPVTIGAGNPSGSQSSFSVSPASFVAGDAAGSTVTVTAKDASGNPIAGAAAAVAVTGTNTVTTPAPTDANGETTATVTSNQAGVKTVTVTINGVTVTNPSSAALTVVPGPVSLTVSTVSASPATLVAGNGSSSTITVTVKDALGNPISGATVSLASATATITQPAGSTNASGVATGSVSYATTGSKFVSATVNGSISLSQTASITVNPAPTTTTISAPGSATAGVGFSVTVTVSPVAPAGGTPSGTVTVSDGVDSCVPAITLAGGSGSCTLTLNTTGSRTVTATYSGDVNYAVSSKTTTVNVSGTPTTTIVTSSTGGVSVWGQGVTFTATLTSGSGTPTGSVSFYGGGGSCPGTTLLASNVALDGSGQASTPSITSLSVAAHTIRACYTPTGSFSASSSTVGQTVSKASTTATIGTVTPSTTVVGESYSVSVSVTVNSPGAGTPTGNVNVSDGTGGACSITLPSTSCSLTSTSAGGKTLVATYVGDGNFNGDASPGTSHTVNQASTTTAITSDLSASTTTADPITVNYKVSVASPGAGTPTGSVTVALDALGGGENCTGTVAVDGTGTCTIPAPINAGARTVTATYGGDANFAGSASSAVPHTVTP
jgi:Invasin, domain 3/Bacterial Ig-like domain (group 1)/Bacterial Ig-like domain (group 3)